jgi:hypothetical protein
VSDIFPIVIGLPQISGVRIKMAAVAVETLEGEHETFNDIPIESAKGDDVDRGVVDVVGHITESDAKIKGEANMCSPVNRHSCPEIHEYQTDSSSKQPVPLSILKYCEKMWKNVEKITLAEVIKIP